MTTPAPIHVAVVLDRSGSMASIADDMVGGFNAFLAEQRTEPGQCAVTLVQFDSHDPFEVLIDAMPLAELTDLDRSAYLPRGMTPLLDAVGRMIATIDARQAAHPDEDQIVLVITDGLENASAEFDLATVRSLIEDRRAAGWSFVFLGADQDAFAEGGRIGASQANRIAWEKSEAGSRRLWEETSDAVRSQRLRSKSERLGFSERLWEERERRSRETGS